MERSDLPDKLFAEDTLSYPDSVDGERPDREERVASREHGGERGTAPGGRSSDDDMLAVEYREDELRAAPSPDDREEDTPIIRHGGRTN